MSLLITNIQRFSLYDGPGIRTTVFLKGCSLKCPWCCNPENVGTHPEFYINSKQCISCQQCVEICPQNLLESQFDILKIDNNVLFDCLECKKCFDVCPTNALGIYGEEIKTGDLLKILKKDVDYYPEGNGGVTFSGGEPLMQSLGLLECLSVLKEKNIHITMETSLFSPLKNLKAIEDLVDLWIIDIKILNAEKCKETLKGDLKSFMANIKELMAENKDIIFRMPLVTPYTAGNDNLSLLYAFLTEYHVDYLEIFSVHHLAREKYRSLGLEVKTEITSFQGIEEFKKKLENEVDIKVKILNI